MKNSIKVKNAINLIWDYENMIIFIIFLSEYMIDLIIIIINDAYSNNFNKSSKTSKSHDRLKKFVIIKLNTTVVILRNIVLKKSFAESSYYEFNISIINYHVDTT